MGMLNDSTHADKYQELIAKEIFPSYPAGK